MQQRDLTEFVSVRRRAPPSPILIKRNEKSGLVLASVPFEKFQSAVCATRSTSRSRARACRCACCAFGDTGTGGWSTGGAARAQSAQQDRAGGAAAKEANEALLHFKFRTCTLLEIYLRKNPGR